MWLKLRWARFFTLAGWKWKLSPRPGFDFQVTFPCRHSECHGSHTLVVRVVDKCRDALQEKHYATFSEKAYYEPNPALFGDGPENTFWVMVHGEGGGEETAENWTYMNANQLWERSAHD